MAEESMFSWKPKTTRQPRQEMEQYLCTRAASHTRKERNWQLAQIFPAAYLMILTRKTKLRVIGFLKDFY